MNELLLKCLLKFSLHTIEFIVVHLFSSQASETAIFSQNIYFFFNIMFHFLIKWNAGIMERHYTLILNNYKILFTINCYFIIYFFLSKYRECFWWSRMGFLRAITDNKIKKFCAFFSFPELFHNRLWFMEKNAMVFPQTGLDPSTRQQLFLSMGKRMVEIQFTDRFCPTVESEMVDQNILPSLYSYQKGEI